jgi:putative flippase GtrA
MRQLVAQLTRFGMVGASNTVVTLVTYALALRAGARYLPAGAGAFALGGLNGFLLNRAWTFSHRGRALPAGARYAIVQLAALLLDVILLWIAVHLAGVPRLPAQLVAAVPVTLANFALSRLWVFPVQGGAPPRRLRAAEPDEPLDPPPPPADCVPGAGRPRSHGVPVASGSAHAHTGGS